MATESRAGPAEKRETPAGHREDVRHLVQALELLERHTRVLRVMSLLVGVLALTALGCFVGMLVMRAAGPGGSSLALAVVGLAVCCGGLGMLYVWERRRKEAMTIYEEISDELEWSHREGRVGKGKPMLAPLTVEEPLAYAAKEAEKAKRPGLDVRIALRRFLTATDLPLAPGPMAVSIYAILFVVCLLAIAVLASGANGATLMLG